MSPTETFIELYSGDGVCVYENHEHGGAWLIVVDKKNSLYRITLEPHEGKFHVGISAAWSDSDPGQMANYSEYVPHRCELDEIKVDDKGLLVVMTKHDTASAVDFRSGFTAQLPQNFVAPMRVALRRVAELAQQNNS